MPTTFNWIYLGRAADIDSIEGNTRAENAASLSETTWGSSASPLHGRITTVTTSDTNRDGALNQNAAAGSESFTTDVGSGPQVLTFDAAVQCRVTLTYADGTTGTAVMVLAQDVTGHLFLAPSITANGATSVQEAKPILSLHINSVTGSDFSGLAASRAETGWDDGIVEGTAGNDLIDAGYLEPVSRGSDRVDGGDGTSGSTTGWHDDSIRAGAGNDSVQAGLGNDTVDGGSGADSIDGGLGADSIVGGTGNDTLLGGAGSHSDTILGGQGDDFANSGDGADSVDGGEGNDTILAGSGDDLVSGGDGADSIFGGSGNDTIDGGTGADSLQGGLGSDRFTGIGIGDSVDGSEDAPSAENDVLDLFGSGWTKATTNILYAGGNDEAGTVEFLDGGGAVIGTMTFSNIETIIPCFTSGALIDTIAGPVPVEDLVEGDLVLTRDSGYQPLKWIGCREVSAAALADFPHLVPILIGAGSLGPGCPSRNLVVSPQHRMLVTGPRAELIAGEAEVLVAAVHLLDRPGIVRCTPPMPVCYVHILFDRHEIVRADGAWSESFQPGDATLSAMGNAQRDEILTIFPGLDATSYPPARTTLKPHEARLAAA